MAVRKIYQWQRFWCPADGSYSLDNDGFLADPKSEWGQYYSSTALTFDEIPVTPCLVLLGEPGIGKTKALENAFNSYSSGQNQAVWVDLRSYTSDVGLIAGIESNPLIQNWLKGEYHLVLFLDSLDEGLLNIRTISALLIDLLRRWPRKRLEIKFACRTSDWPKLLDKELPLLFNLPEIPKYELLPLRKVDVEAASAVEGIDPSLFLRAVRDAEASAFANRPVTLNFLLNSYKVYGRLSEHKSETYWQGCVHLCEEKNESRLDSRHTGKLMPTQRVIVAARIAAVMVFSNKYAIWTDLEGNIAKEDLSISSLSGYSEKIDGIDFVVDSDAVKETLGTGLFNSRGASRIGFSHQTYLEYLAAYYLIQKRVPTEKMLGLITYSDGKIIPQLQETTTWLATFSKNIFSALFNAQPEVLLRIPKNALTPSDKKKFLEKLLDHYQSGNLVEEHKVLRYLDRLEYSGMEGLLSSYLSDSKKKTEVRRVAILIVRECKVVNLVEILVSIALNQDEDQSIREHAAYAVLVIGRTDACTMLTPLALGMAGEDPQDELKGIGLKAIWGKREIITDLLESITPVKNENLIGTYYHFLAYELAESIRIDQLFDVLNWLLTRKTNLGNEILEDSMIQSIMLRAWNQFLDPDITAVFSKLVYKRLLGHQEYRATSYGRTYINELSGDSTKRRILVSQVVDLMDSSKEAFYLSQNPNFLSHDDVDWIIENIEQRNDDNKREIWSQLLFYIADLRSHDDLSKIYDVYVKYSVTHGVFSRIFEPVDLNSEIAKQMRDYENQSKAIEQARAVKPVNQLNPQSQLLSYIDQFGEGDIDAWWKLNLLFLGSDPNKGGHEFDFDLTSFTLWESIESQTKDSLVLMAEKYLVLHPGGEIYLDDNRVFRPAISAFRALYLIAIKKPELLNNLSADVWRKWASVIISYPAFEGKIDLATHQALISKLLQVSREQFYYLLRAQIIKEERVSQYLRVLKLIENLDTQQLQELLVEVLESDVLSPPSFGQIVQYLLERNNIKAKQIALRYVTLEVQDDDILLQKRFQASRLLIFYAGDAGWPTIGNQIKNDEKYGEQLFQSLAYDRHNLAGVLVSKLSERKVAELYLWLEERFPETNDPKVAGFHEVSERESVGQFREMLVATLAGKGTESACLALRQLLTKYPEKSNLPYYLQMCEEKMRHNNWNPNLPYHILEVTRTAYSESILDLRRKQNWILATISLFANIFIIILPGVLDYKNNILFNFLASNQTLSITILIFSTLASMYVNLNRSITE